MLGCQTCCEGLEVFGVDDMKYFLALIRQRLEDDIIFVRFVDADDVDDLVIVRNFEREFRVAQFTVKLLEFQNDLPSMNFDLTLSLQPATQALKVD